MAGLELTISREEPYLCVRCGRRGDGIVAKQGPDDCYHLFCAPVPSFLRLDSSIVTVDLDLPSDLNLVHAWIAQHNQSFRLPLQVCFQRYSQHIVQPGLYVAKRALLEAFKFIDRKEVALSAGPVCKEWYFAAWNTELWDGNRVSWLYAWKTSCMRCNKKLLSEEDIGLLRPDTKRWLCVNCRNTREMKLISLPTFCYIRGLSHSQAIQFRLPGLQLLNRDVTFLETAAIQLQVLRSSYRQELLAQLAKSHRLNSSMEKALLDLRLDLDFDIREYGKSPYVELIRSVLLLKRPRMWPKKGRKCAN